MLKSSRHIHINGIVQGVGFRPFIFNLAAGYGLFGWVCNSASGVDIEISGDPEILEQFCADIPLKAPPLAQIDSIDIKEIPLTVFESFEIISSQDKATDFIPVSPDVAICDQCRTELFDPQDRRYRYPFINCTNCGPRFTIIKEIPYDRPKTTMAGFEMCPDCREEYENPADRRFHAQPVACPVCGPQVWLEDYAGTTLNEKDDAILTARQMLADGKILAIKGLGGFHLACDAHNPEAVARLRERKHRPAKPFALMAFDLEATQKYVEVSDTAETLLKSPQAPILLLPKQPGSHLAENVASGQTNLGFMLPYTPLHLLLLEPEPGYPDVLVMTSGNLSEAPVIRQNQEAREKLSGIVDAFLMHDRPIHMRVDDSVFMMVNEAPYPIRRARGYAPNPIRLDFDLPQILATGPQMKNTFCLTRDRYAFLSHYIGEMENWETYQDFQEAIRHYEGLFRLRPELLACDLHPDYLASQYARAKAADEGLPLYEIQHHHAHLAAGMVENGVAPETRVAGLIFDGTGYGLDGTIWGGEVLVGNCDSFERHYHLKTVPLPGGEAAIRKPARMALSTLWAYGFPWDESLPPVQAFSEVEKQALITQLEKGLNTPQTSSMGRLFDAIAALIGVRQAISYEAQAAIELEGLVELTESGYYPFVIKAPEINLQPMLAALLKDLQGGVSQSVMAARFHNTIARLALALAQQIQKADHIDRFVLSGGVWQNQVLLGKTLALFQQNNLTALIHRQTPPNDGCVAFGQAMIAAYRYQNHKE
ncbi:MAG: carbamoyltransferase HypF [Anaerolineaceae bacterium]|nr:carbamoyltransferase HypF [Anaerolineaceae bacterium]